MSAEIVSMKHYRRTGDKKSAQAAWAGELMERMLENMSPEDRDYLLERAEERKRVGQGRGGAA